MRTEQQHLPQALTNKVLSGFTVSLILISSIFLLYIWKGFDPLIDTFRIFSLRTALLGEDAYSYKEAWKQLFDTSMTGSLSIPPEMMHFAKNNYLDLACAFLQKNFGAVGTIFLSIVSMAFYAIFEDFIRSESHISGTAVTSLNNIKIMITGSLGKLTRVFKIRGQLWEFCSFFLAVYLLMFSMDQGVNVMKSSQLSALQEEINVKFSFKDS